MGGDLKLDRTTQTATVDLIAAGAERARRSPDAARTFFERFAAADPTFEPLLVKLHHGNLAVEAESILLDRLGKGDHLQREAIRRYADQLRRDLLGPVEVTAVERVVVDRAVLCYLALQVAEANLAAWDEKRPRDFAEKRVDRAQRRFLEVLKALDHLRKKVPTAHLARVRVLGDLMINPPVTAPVPAPVVIDLAPDPEVPER